MQSSQSEKQILHRDQVSHDKSADKIIHPMPDTKTLKKTFEKDASDIEPKLFSTISHCTFRLTLIKSNLCYISKNYLTTNDPSWNMIQKILKIRNLYSTDPDSGSGIRKI